MGVHGKNFSIRQAPSGLWEATPAYDLVSTQPYLDWRDPMSLPMYERANTNRLHELIANRCDELSG